MLFASAPAPSSLSVWCARAVTDQHLADGVLTQFDWTLALPMTLLIAYFLFIL